jgi:hypothetical protein
MSWDVLPLLFEKVREGEFRDREQSQNDLGNLFGNYARDEMHSESCQ